MKIQKGGITREILPERLPEFLEKGFSLVEKEPLQRQKESGISKKKTKPKEGDFLNTESENTL